MNDALPCHGILHASRDETSAHYSTRCSAPVAGFDAGSHLYVLIESRAIRGAAFTDFCACVTNNVVLVGTAQHEIGSCLADLDTIRNQADVWLVGEPAANSQAMMNGYQADIMTRLAVSNAILQVPPLIRS